MVTAPPAPKTEEVKGEATVESRIVGWCRYGRFWDEYEGPQSACPQSGCLPDEREHFLTKRRMYVCAVCGFATTEKRETCDHTEAEFF